MTVTIRAAQIPDVPALASLAALTFPLACPPDAGETDIAAFIGTNLAAENFDGFIVDPRAAVLVAEEHGALLAYSLLVAEPPSDSKVAAAVTALPAIELSKFYVHPEHHGGGTARRLMNDSVNRARKFGGASVWLGVNSENTRALRFYAKCGFHEVGTKSFRLGARVEHDFVLQLVIDDYPGTAGIR
ncbi:GNAT family N-acetyltransferase [Arthrobacter sp. A5]|uniref:GNAT family N-acetyltransferase n=1 Tax=Arthrobacter sp. A5 TaxID=576926 RepID=UPI003DA87410